MREPSKDSKREPTPREKSTVKDRDEKREKDKRREKRSASAEFEGDLSSVSSNGSSMPNNADVVIVEEQRGKFSRYFSKTLLQ